MNTTHKYLAKIKNNYKSNSILTKWYMIYSHKIKYIIIFQEYRMNQICKIKTWHNHLTLNNKERFYINIYLNQKRQHPTSRLLFALITTISPDINACEHQLINIPNQDWTSILLDKMTTLRNPPKRHIRTLHPYTKFINNHKKLINSPTTIHKEIFDFIHQESIPATIQTLTQKFPFLPNRLLNETLRIYEPLNKYSHPPPIPQIPPPPIPNETQNINNNTQIISWNASSLNTTLPNLQDIIRHTNPAIIAIQETKLTGTKSTKYIQNFFLQYKLIFNNTHALTRCIQQRILYTPTRGGLLTLINQKYAFLGNITKIPSRANISPYLQIIYINNHPIQPWLMIHLYMLSHSEDLRLIPIIQQTIRIQIDAHPNHTYILCGDFNRNCTYRTTE